MKETTASTLALEKGSKMQQTVAKAFTQSGVGLHTGLEVQCECYQRRRTGRYFVRVDMHSQPIIPAGWAVGDSSFDSVGWEGLCAHGGASVGSAGNDGVDNARIEIDGPEVPLLDGSAQLWVEAIASVGSQSVPSHGERGSHLQEPIWVYQGDAFVAALPAPEARFTYGIDFDLPAIGNQWHSWLPLSV